VLDPRLGVVEVTATELIADRSKALEAIGRLGIALRRGLGERNLRQDSLPSDETFTTSSLDAAREYVIAQDLLVSGRAESHYSNFLAPRANAHDARSEDVRRRLARLQ